MKNFRITKYNPKFRNEDGIFNKKQWTSYDDIGKDFDGEVLTLSEYMKYEDAYMEAIKIVAKANNITEMIVSDLEIYSEEEETNLEYSINEGKSIQLNKIYDVCRQILRESLWCKFEVNEKMYIHFGYDYYMYIGCNKFNIDIEKEINSLGLFIEEMESPYKSLT